jgi:ribosomal-protein-alanine N-acetyltransferase
LQAVAKELKEEIAEVTKPGFPETFPRIETTRLILREIAQDDASGIFKNFSDPDVAKWFFEQPLTEMDQVTQIIDEFNREFVQGKGLTWAIILKESGTCIGTCGYGEVESGDRGEIGFDLAKEQWGKGLMTEGITAIIDYGFEALNLLKVEAHTYSNNTRAIRLLEKLGFQLDNVSEDSHCFSLSKEDWDLAQP